MMQEQRSEKYKDIIAELKSRIAGYSDLEQAAILHELVDDTPYKTKDYMKYVHEEYYIKHNKSEILKKCRKCYTLDVDPDQPSKGITELIKNRNSVRDYENKTVRFKEFSEIVYWSMGLKQVGRGAYDQREFPFKYCNSQGGLNHLDLYLIVNNVEHVESGLYYYDFIGNRICQMDWGNMRGVIGAINFQNEFSVYSNFVGIIVTDLSRVVPKYCKRAYRIAHVDAGILADHLQLMAENTGLSSCIVAGFLEHKIEELLELSQDEYPVVTMSFGYQGA